MQLQDYASAEKDLYAAIKQSRKSYAVYRTLYSALEAQSKDDEAMHCSYPAAAVKIITIEG